MTTLPYKLTLRMYNVGFGDCFLLKFHYAGGEDRHILIDFGTTGGGFGEELALLGRIARDIAARCRGKLHAVVATHRHKDHISGFSSQRSGRGPGDIIASLRPEVVVQPWTEDPRAPLNARHSLHVLHSLSAAILREAGQSRLALAPELLEELRFLGEDNLPNLRAIANLQRMGKRSVYVRHGSLSGLEQVLPGVTVRVLGPPDLTQTGTIRQQRRRDDDEFWHLQALSLRAPAGGGRLFPRSPAWPAPRGPFHTRWFVRGLHALRGKQMLNIVRALDQTLNNTSVILLFEVGGKKLLFPGDAQIESWAYALAQPGARELLADVNLYKVGHHGSLNATPKSLWRLFRRRSPSAHAGRLLTLLSTLPHKHGHAESDTEVPRSTLVHALRANSDFFSTQQIHGRNKLYEDVSISF